jgi:hypothetical protein
LKKDEFWNTSISCLIYLFTDLYCKKILAEKTKLQHDLQNHLEKKRQLEYDLSSYKKRLAKQNMTEKEMKNGNPKLKTNEGNTTVYCTSVYEHHYKMFYIKIAIFLLFQLFDYWAVHSF